MKQQDEDQSHSDVDEDKSLPVFRPMQWYYPEFSVDYSADTQSFIGP